MAIDWNLVATVLAAITIIIVVFWNGIQHRQMNKQLRIQTEQIKHNFFSEYTKRYQEIIWHLPENIYDDSFSYEDLDEEKRDTIMRCMRVYFDLCSEELFLHQNKYIDEKVWKEWEDGMDSIFKRPAFRGAWNKISKDPTLYKDFKKFADSKMRSHDG